MRHKTPIVLILMLVLLATMASARVYDATIRSGEGSLSEFSRGRVCDFAIPFAENHIFQLQDGTEFVGYNESELFNLSEDISENLTLEVSAPLVELFLADIPGMCGAIIIFPPVVEEIPEEEVEIAFVKPLAAVTGETVAEIERPSTLPFFQFSIGAWKPPLLLRFIFAIDETSVLENGEVSYDVVGLRLWPVLPLVLIGLYYNFGWKKKKKKK